MPAGSLVEFMSCCVWQARGQCRLVAFSVTRILHGSIEQSLANPQPAVSLIDHHVLDNCRWMQRAAQVAEDQDMNTSNHTPAHHCDKNPLITVSNHSPQCLLESPRAWTYVLSDVQLAIEIFKCLRVTQPRLPDPDWSRGRFHAGCPERFPFLLAQRFSAGSANQPDN